MRVKKWMLVIGCILFISLKLTAAPVPHCNKSLWKHVYHPARLVVVKPCVAVTGTVVHVLRKPDGDAHLDLLLDAPYKSMLNMDNMGKQHGWLVVEFVCQYPVKQPDAKAACQGFRGTVTIPKAHERVKVVGAWVHDKKHKSKLGPGWSEIHPVTSITVIQ